ncbi:MAG: hypothetical protein FWG11_00840 [Promicromonosporaceae bacterium]|nr:hypothetical protein [Promicromonosporaceae bacterium]
MRSELPDVNVLVALCYTDHEHHGLARQWFDAVGTFGTTPITEVGLIRLLMNPAVTDADLTYADAAAALSRLRADERWEFWPDLSSLQAPLVDTSSIRGFRQMTDLHLLNLAAGRGGTLVTLDRKLAGSLGRTDRTHLRVLG